MMSLKDKLRGAVRRIAGAKPATDLVDPKRRTAALPNILNTYGSRLGVMPKATPANLRRFAETPVARKAINTIKDRIAGMRWRVQPRHGRAIDGLVDGALRVQILTENLDAPNPDDSFRSMTEQVLEDV